MDCISTLTPHMSTYAGEFSDDGQVNWLPYVMYFHPFNFKSSVVNTDEGGFRFSEYGHKKYALHRLEEDVHSVNVLAGSSTVFGIGASSDRMTLSSRLSERNSGENLWINFGGRSYNSTQEMILFSLNRHKLPKVDNIVLFSGFNDLGLARLPDHLRLEHGAFFMCQHFFDAIKTKKQSLFSGWFSEKDKEEVFSTTQRDLEEQIMFAASLTLRNLRNWRAMAQDMGATLTFVLQPLSSWVREKGTQEETLLFAELEKKGKFSENYGDILNPACHKAYRAALQLGASALGITFIDMAALLQSAVQPHEWLFVDRIHFTDFGYDLAAKLLLENLTK